MGTQLPLEKGHTHPTKFLAHVYCGQTAGWMKTPLGTVVALGPGHTALDGVAALRERDTAAPLFSAHVCCGHDRPSQLLLSSCKTLAGIKTILLAGVSVKLRLHDTTCCQTGCQTRLTTG